MKYYYSELQVRWSGGVKHLVEGGQVTTIPRESYTQVVVYPVWLSGTKRLPQDGRSEDAGGRTSGIAVGVSIFVARGIDHPESKLPYGEVRGAPAGEFAFWAVPSKRLFGITGEEYSGRRHGVIEQDGSETVASGALVAKKDPDSAVSGDRTLDD
jgi:hypothetical protein